MLRKILLIVAIVAGLAAAVVNFTVVKAKIDILTQDRNDQRSAKVQAQTELAATKKKLKATEDELAQTQSQLKDSEAARDQLSHQVAALNTQIADLTDKLAKTTQARDDAQNQLAAYKASGLTPEQVASLNKDLKNTQEALDVANEEKAVLTHTVAKLQNKLDDLLGNTHPVELPAGLKGTVMAVDPKWNFVVINVGGDQGVLENGEMLVSRDGKLVGKVIVRSVQKDRSIANLVPGWQLGDIIEGDIVIPAHPASS